MKILIINGPNINLLGRREKEVYGERSYEDLNKELISYAAEKSIGIEIYQSNHEGEIVDRIHSAEGKTDFVLINPGAYTHYSYAIRDAIAAVDIRTIEIHISNIHAREDFRNRSVIAPVCLGQISGLGTAVYKIGILAAMELA